MMAASLSCSLALISIGRRPPRPCKYCAVSISKRKKAYHSSLIRRNLNTEFCTESDKTRVVAISQDKRSNAQLSQTRIVIGIRLVQPLKHLVGLAAKSVNHCHLIGT